MVRRAPRRERSARGLRLVRQAAQDSVTVSESGAGRLVGAAPGSVVQAPGSVVQERPSVSVRIQLGELFLAVDLALDLAEEIPRTRRLVQQ